MGRKRNHRNENKALPAQHVQRLAHHEAVNVQGLPLLGLAAQNAQQFIDGLLDLGEAVAALQEGARNGEQGSLENIKKVVQNGKLSDCNA